MWLRLVSLSDFYIGASSFGEAHTLCEICPNNKSRLMLDK